MPLLELELLTYPEQSWAHHMTGATTGAGTSYISGAVMSSPHDGCHHWSCNSLHLRSTWAHHMTSATTGAGIPYISGAHELTTWWVLLLDLELLASPEHMSSPHDGCHYWSWNSLHLRSSHELTTWRVPLRSWNSLHPRSTWAHHPVISEVCVARSLVFCVVFCRLFLSFSDFWTLYFSDFWKPRRRKSRKDSWFNLEIYQYRLTGLCWSWSGKQQSYNFLSCMVLFK